MKEITLDGIKYVAKSDCEKWAHYTDRNGYGHARYGGKVMLAHRIAWIKRYGAIGSGMHVLHKCDNPSCVNIGHLFIGTHQENMRDRDMKGRQGRPIGLRNARYTHPENTARGIRHGMHTRPDKRSCGSKNGNAKLNEQIVRRIREQVSNGKKQAVLAIEMNLSTTTINDICRGKSWAWLS